MELLNPLSLARANALFPSAKLQAQCLPSDSVGKCVYITGPALWGLYQVTTANPLDGAVKMPALGVLISKSTSTDCLVQVHGELIGLIGSLTPNKLVFVSATGDLTHTPPSPGVGGVAYIQSMGIALSTDRILVLPDFSITKRIG